MSSLFSDQSTAKMEDNLRPMSSYRGDWVHWLEQREYQGNRGALFSRPFCSSWWTMLSSDSFLKHKSSSPSSILQTEFISQSDGRDRVIMALSDDAEISVWTFRTPQEWRKMDTSGDGNDPDRKSSKTKIIYDQHLHRSSLSGTSSGGFS